MRQRRIIEFFVDRMQLRDRTVSVIGRCLDSPIALNDRFNSIRAMTHARDCDNRERNISLTVKEINVGPARCANLIDPSYTGELILAGTGAQLIVSGTDVICGESDIAVPEQLVFRKE